VLFKLFGAVILPSAQAPQKEVRMVNIQQIAHRIWQPIWQRVWSGLPARARHFLQPYHRKLFSDRLIVVFWPTFRCNYSCSYCPVHTKFDFATVFPKACEKTWQQWVEALEKLPPAVIYIAGGEPFLYAGLPDLLNNLPAKHRMLGIVSNISVPTPVFQKIQHSTHLNASFHRECVSEEAFLAKVKVLQESFHVEVNIVATPENLPVIAAVDELLKSHDVSLHVDPFVDLGFHYSEEQLELLRKHTQTDRKALPEFDDFSQKSCSAGRNYINLMPNGDVFTCASGYQYIYSPLNAHLAAGKKLDQFRMGNLFELDFSLNTTDILCTMPCQAYCDRDAVLVKLIEPAPGSNN
jgi:MoaA/NifB/PqqE/SkfB family radical SAM enzyme